MREIVQSREEFVALGPHWEKLAAAARVGTPFQSFAWLSQWQRYRRMNVEPFILVLHGGETIAPIGRRTCFGIRVLQMLGSPDSDYEGLVTTRPLDEAWDRVARVLWEQRRSFDLLHLHSVQEREPVVSALASHLWSGGRERPYEICPWISTQGTWSDLLVSRGAGLRNEVKRWNRRMQELGEIKIERVRPPLGDALLAELGEVERSSWKWQQGNAAFGAGSQGDFLKAVLRDSRIDLVVWLLRVANRLVAYAVVLIGQSRWYYYLTSFRKDAANAGSLLLSHIVEAACAEECQVLDLLRGNHGYKRAWTDLTHPVHEIVWPANVRGRAAVLGYAARWWAAKSDLLHRLRSLLWRVGDRR